MVYEIRCKVTSQYSSKITKFWNLFKWLESIEGLIFLQWCYCFKHISAKCWSILYQPIPITLRVYDQLYSEPVSFIYLSVPHTGFTFNGAHEHGVLPKLTNFVLDAFVNKFSKSSTHRCKLFLFFKINSLLFYSLIFLSSNAHISLYQFNTSTQKHFKNGVQYICLVACPSHSLLYFILGYN